FGWFWTHGGQTLGMRAWKIRVTDEYGRTLNWQQAFFRYTMAILSWLMLGVGFWIAIFDPQKLAWHDRLSRTRLIRTE
ncbi:MAG: RDD family protein, partial [Thiothrix sp.]|nr:RDD family protein [Thiothrix sp.]